MEDQGAIVTMDYCVHFLQLLSWSLSYLFIFVIWKVINSKYTLNQGVAGQGKTVLCCDAVGKPPETEYVKY